MEQWKPVVGYENTYEVSDRGRVRSVDRIVKAGIRHNDNVFKKGKMLKLVKKKTGYLSFDASSENKVKTCNVHRAVAMAFIDNPLNKPCVNHKNAIKDDNRVENLEWVTYQENSDHAGMLDLFPKKQSRLILCVEANKEFINSVEAAKWLNEIKFNYTKDVKMVARSIRGACTGKKKSCYGYRWKDLV